MSNLTRIPDDYTVWAFSDPHGVRRGLEASLRVAGLIDATGRWSAAPRTALVGIGDYIDRGADPLGVLRLLWRLRSEAQAAGSLVVLAAGNHEALLAGVLAGQRESYKVWVSDFAGGAITARALGASATDLAQGVEHLAAVIEQYQPGLRDELAAMPDAVLWRDVLLCHAGPPPNSSPDWFGRADNDHLWELTPLAAAPRWEESDLDSDLYDGYRAAGIERFVFGHQSFEQATFFQSGRALCLDTNTSGGAPGIRSATATLARIPPDGTLGAADLVEIDTRSAPDRQPPR